MYDYESTIMSKRQEIGSCKNKLLTITSNFQPFKLFQLVILLVIVNNFNAYIVGESYIWELAFRQKV